MCGYTNAKRFGGQKSLYNDLRLLGVFSRPKNTLEQSAWPISPKRMLGNAASFVEITYFICMCLENIIDKMQLGHS